MGKCKWYHEAPRCPHCGEYTGIVSQTLRYCEKCDITFELSEEDKQRVQLMNQNGFDFPKEFDKKAFKKKWKNIK